MSRGENLKRLKRRIDGTSKSKHRVLASDLRSVIKRLAAASSDRRAAVAYVTSENEIAFGEGDVLVVDSSDAMIAGGQTSAGVLRRAHRRGATLFSVAGLHAKLFLFDKTAVIGSVNLSSSNLIEAGLVTTDHVVIAGVASLIDEFTRLGTPIDETFLARIEKIAVRRPVFRYVPRSAQKVRARGNRTWLVAIKELPEHAFPGEAKAAERGLLAAEGRLSKKSSSVSWIRFTGNSRFRREACKGDSVIQIHTGLGQRRPRVWPPSPILHIPRTRAYRRFYVETFADDETALLSWTEFSRFLVECRGESPSRHAVREIPADVATRVAENWPRR